MIKMKHTFTLKGMTCGGCKASVEKHLNLIDGVTVIEVNLEKEEVKLTTTKPISLKVLQDQLPPKFTLSASITDQETSASSKSVEQSKLKQLQPLFLILFYIGTVSLLLHYKDWNIHAVMLDFMGLFFIVFSFFKMLDLKNFPSSFAMYDPLAKRVSIYGWLYPFIETALGLMFLMRYEVTLAVYITLVILSITTLGVSRTLMDKKKISCACLGTSLKLPMTEATFIENLIMIVMCLLTINGT